jgi:hypothetical protein
LRSGPIAKIQWIWSFSQSRKVQRSRTMRGYKIYTQNAVSEGRRVEDMDLPGMRGGTMQLSWVTDIDVEEGELCGSGAERKQNKVGARGEEGRVGGRIFKKRSSEAEEEQRSRRRELIKEERRKE